MRAKPHPSRINRLIAFCGVVGFLVLVLWMGMGLPKDPRTPLKLPAGGPRRTDPGPRAGLTIVSGPELIRGDEGRKIRWTTSEPSDSLLTCGENDPFDKILAKDQRMVREHIFDLPAGPFVDLYRYRVMSVSAEREVVAATLHPGVGPGGTLFARAPEGLDALDGASAIAWSDFDRDGDVDPAVARTKDETTHIRLFRRTGMQLTPAETVRLPGAVNRLQWGDVTGDGHPDLLASGSRPYVLVNHGPPGWQLEIISKLMPEQDEVAFRTAQFAELNGDGLPDLLVSDAAGRIRVFLNAPGAPTIFTRASFSPLPAPSEGDTPVLCSADFTGDGRDDILALGSKVQLWGRTEDGMELLSRDAAGFGDSGREVTAAAIADYDGDGDPDVYVVSADQDGGVLLENVGSGRLRRVKGRGALAETGPVACAGWADLTGNAAPDLVVGRVDGGVVVLLNEGTGEFYNASGVAGVAGMESLRVEDVTLADFSGDSAPDMLLAVQQGPAVLMENRSRAARNSNFVRVRPIGTRGVIGAEVRLMDHQGSNLLATGRIKAGKAPPECSFGLQALPNALIEVRFSDGATASKRWRRGGSASVMRISRDE